MAGVQRIVGDLDQPGAVAVDDEYGVQAVRATAVRFKGQLLYRQS